MIIFLHGFLGSPEDWNPLTQHLKKPFKVLTLPGHCGKPLVSSCKNLSSDSRSDFSIEQSAERENNLNESCRVRAQSHMEKDELKMDTDSCNLTLNLSLLEKEIPDGVTLVGYSLGGRIAMDFARRFPEKVRSLIILSANPGLESGKEERIAQDEKWISIIENEGMDRFLEKWYAQGLFSSFSLTEEIKKRRKEHDPESLIEILRTLSPAKLPSLWPQLKNFSFPLLFLFGENDIKYQKIGKRLMENHEVMWIPNASHPIHLETPETVAEIINNVNLG